MRMKVLSLYDQILTLVRKHPELTDEEIADRLGTTKNYVKTALKRARKKGESLPSKQERLRAMAKRRDLMLKKTKAQIEQRMRVCKLRERVKEKLTELYGDDFLNFLKRVYPCLPSLFKDGYSSWEEKKLQELLDIVEEELKLEKVV